MTTEERRKRLVEFQEKNCLDCVFVNELELALGHPCCNYRNKVILHVATGVCCTKITKN